jgi:DNA-binding CsgD family transcriptional regulator
MSNLVFLIIGGTFGIFGCLLAAIIAYLNQQRSQALLLIGLENAEKDLIDDIERIGTVALEKTSAGTELLLLRKYGHIAFILGKELANEQNLKEKRSELDNLAVISIVEMQNLTIKEQDILFLMIEGNTNNQIAEKLGATPSETRAIISRIRKKVRVDDKVLDTLLVNQTDFDISAEPTRAKTRGE